jgi:hypothetical protein
LFPDAKAATSGLHMFFRTKRNMLLVPVLPSLTDQSSPALFPATMVAASSPARGTSSSTATVTVQRSASSPVVGSLTTTKRSRVQILVNANLIPTFLLFTAQIRRLMGLAQIFFFAPRAQHLSAAAPA